MLRLSDRTKFRQLFPLAIVGLAVGCASATVDSRPQPEAAGRSYDRILVTVQIQDQAERGVAEARFESNGDADGTSFFSSHRLMDTTDSNDSEELTGIIQENSIGALLTIRATSATEVGDMVGGEDCRSGDGFPDGGCVARPFGRGLGGWGGNYQVTRPINSYFAELIDAESSDSLWYATVKVKGTASSGASSQLKKMADALIGQLRKDRLAK